MMRMTQCIEGCRQAYISLVECRILVFVGMSKSWASPPTATDGRCAQPGEEKIECEKIIAEDLRAVPLHHYPEFVEACADLINEEWKRSKASRIHSLQKSSNCFPVCLVLIRTLKNAGRPRNETKGQLVGHSRLSHVVGKPTGLFVETVVVAKEFRGKGYGRKLMEATEAYAKLRGFNTLYLTTHDKQHFYSHLGYVLSNPVQNAGSMTTFMHIEFLEKLSLGSTLLPSSNSSHFQPSGTVLGCSSYVSSGTTSHPTSPNSLSAHICSQTSHPTPNPPPISPTAPSLQISTPPIFASFQTCKLSPPPPSYPISSSQSNGSVTSTSTCCPGCGENVRKHQAPVSYLSTPPQLDVSTSLPPPPPLPPPQLPQLPYHSHLSGDKCRPYQQKGTTTQSLLETPYKDVKGLPVFWMKKAL
ncbi:N-alpha-acetyltransferase 80-like isoform X4 [Chiloscyllium plagiosum]|uniref:N-alpha-acetyltransferase 80-like isoform X4 n=1 Tax=Chiloscyllium plagiosum TaxID=36176 RepID=UPI001CB7E0B8|nr:N-alpha-acetyltransferase 80-like isoform X4 [Chiloscyllium plagiosum]